MSKSKTKHHHLDGEPVMALNCGDFGGFFLTMEIVALNRTKSLCTSLIERSVSAKIK